MPLNVSQMGSTNDHQLQHYLPTKKHLQPTKRRQHHLQNRILSQKDPLLRCGLPIRGG